MDWDSNRKFGVAAREEIAALTGREFLQAIIDGRLPGPPIAKVLTFALVEVADGVAIFEGEPGPHLLNPMGGVHGGWALTLIDSAAGCAAHSTLPAGVGNATIETQVNFTRPIAANTGRVRAEGRVLGRGRTIISAGARIVDAGGRLLAHGTSTVMALRPERG